MSRRQRYRIKTFDPTHHIKHAASKQAAPAYQTEHRFGDFDLPPRLLQNILDRGFDTPTPIQDQAIRPILMGNDVVGSAHTGTGKTAAFLIPLIARIVRGDTSRILIMTPTRELAMQIEKELDIFAQGMPVTSVLCIGGTSIRRQIRALKGTPQFVIGTPGRLIDLTKRKKLDPRSFDTVVLDEVDRMLDMGFVKDMEYMIGRMPDARQSLFFSATHPQQLGSILRRFANDPVTVEITSQRRSANIDQRVMRVKGRSKLQLLKDLLQQAELEKTLVFGRTKRGLNKLRKQLSSEGHRVAIIHGNKSQNQRQRALKQFKYDKVSILLATDVASRGLDIDDITHVINFDLPESKEVYIHRIGRTGRAGSQGVAISFVG